MSTLRVNKITDASGSGPVEFTKGAVIPSTSTLNVENLTCSGIMTVSNLTATNITMSGVCTATTFSGSGIGLTGLSGTTNSKAIALTLIT